MVVSSSIPYSNELIGALSNDLARVASCYGRDSERSAKRFYDEARLCADQLGSMELPQYIQKIVSSVLSVDSAWLTKDYAEDCLMYSVLLQNYALHSS